MRTICLLSAATVVVTAFPGPAEAQYAQVHLGAVGSYGTASAFQEGLGVTGGFLVGRVVYVGARYVRYFGSTTAGDRTTVEDDTRTLTGELGIQIPVGPVEVLAGMGVGAASFGRTGVAPPSDQVTGTTFLFAPSVMARVSVWKLIVGLEGQWLSAAPPAFDEDVVSDALAMSLRVIVPINVNFYPAVVERRWF